MTMLRIFHSTVTLFPCSKAPSGLYEPTQSFCHYKNVITGLPRPMFVSTEDLNN